MFDRVVCLNMKRHGDRWQRFVRSLPDPWPFARPQRFEAVDGRATGCPDWFPGDVGAFGCYRSHLRILEDALCDDIETLLVLEDDAIFVDDFAARAGAFIEEAPTDWHQLYFGGQHLSRANDPPYRVSDNVLRCHNVNRTHGYAMRHAFIKAAYHELCRPPHEPQQQQEFHIDWRYGAMHQSGKWNVYAPMQWLVGQSAGVSSIIGPGKPTEECWWNNTIPTFTSG